MYLLLLCQFETGTVDLQEGVSDDFVYYTGKDS